MTLTTAYARKQAWVRIDCEMCGACYAARVEAVGTADDTWLPLSDDTLKEMAIIGLDFRLQREAARTPCPECGTYPQLHAEAARRLAGRVAAWIIFLVGFVAVVALIAKLFPTTPAWVLLPTALATFVGARIAAGRLAERADPNLDLERNRLLALDRVARGLARKISPPPPLA